jgi:hypothetical protein
MTVCKGHFRISENLVISRSYIYILSIFDFDQPMPPSWELNARCSSGSVTAKRARMYYAWSQSKILLVLATSRGTNRTNWVLGVATKDSLSKSPSSGSIVVGSLRLFTAGRTLKWEIKCKNAVYNALWARWFAMHMRPPMPNAYWWRWVVAVVPALIHRSGLNTSGSGNRTGSEPC